MKKKKYYSYKILKSIKGTDYVKGSMVYGEDNLYLWFLHDGSTESNAHKIECPESSRYYKRVDGNLLTKKNEITLVGLLALEDNLFI